MFHIGEPGSYCSFGSSSVQLAVRALAVEPQDHRVEPFSCEVLMVFVSPVQGVRRLPRLEGADPVGHAPGSPARSGIAGGYHIGPGAAVQRAVLHETGQRFGLGFFLFAWPPPSGPASGCGGGGLGRGGVSIGARATSSSPSETIAGGVPIGANALFGGTAEI